jgi:hypothetical protein
MKMAVGLVFEVAVADDDGDGVFFSFVCFSVPPRLSEAVVALAGLKRMALRGEAAAAEVLVLEEAFEPSVVRRSPGAVAEGRPPSSPGAAAKQRGLCGGAARGCGRARPAGRVEVPPPGAASGGPASPSPSPSAPPSPWPPSACRGASRPLSPSGPPSP